MDTKIDKRTMERIGELKYPIPNSSTPMYFAVNAAWSLISRWGGQARAGIQN